MSTARFLVGDVFDRMAEIPDGSIDLVMTSPPFLALRSYLPADHPDKHKEIGSEPAPAEFLDTMMALSAEWRRVLAPHGSICVELGDTYSGSGGAGGDYAEGGIREGQQAFSGSAAKRRANGVGDDYRPSRAGRGDGWPMAKSLTGIPTLYSWSLAYGRNLLTGQESPAGQWRIRNLVAWVRPNPPVGALGDKFRPATSYLTIATIAGDRYFDLDAVRSELSSRQADTSDPRHEANKQRQGTNFNTLGPYDPAQSGGAPPLDWWNIPPRGYPGSHYAVYPEELCVRPIESMCPRKVCLTCGNPSRRITEVTRLVDREGNQVEPEVWASGIGEGKAAHSNKKTRGTTTTTTTGWSDCGHNNWRPGIVLDPFGGSGTTAAVAVSRGRDAILIDIDERNYELARQRVGMWLSEPDFGGRLGVR